MNSGLSDVAKTQEAPTRKHVGAMSDNPIERTCGRRREGYGFSILSLPQRNDEGEAVIGQKRSAEYARRGKKGINSPSPEKGLFQNLMQYVQQKQADLWKGIPCRSRDRC